MPTLGSIVIWFAALQTFAIHVHSANIDVIDYSCKRDEDCRDFVVPQLNVLSRCVDFQCLCTNGTSTLSQHCIPVHVATGNLVGGRCPCTVPYTVCMAGDVCQCSTNFAPTADKRRCIPNYVRVNDPCERNAQCTRTSVFSRCNAASHVCECLPNHRLLDGMVCQGLVALDFNCTKDEQCEQRVPHAICMHGSCTCDPLYVAGPDNAVCLPNAGFGEPCTANVQCMQRLGPNAICQPATVDAVSGLLAPSRCACDPLVSVTAVLQTGNRTQYLCENRKAIGDFCTTHRDCHQFRPVSAAGGAAATAAGAAAATEDEDDNDEDDTPQLECYLHECICNARGGYVPAEGDGDAARYCVKRSGAAVAGQQRQPLQMMFALTIVATLVGGLCSRRM